VGFEEGDVLLRDPLAGYDPEGFGRIVECNAVGYVAADAVELAKAPEATSLS
jgi:hypothetical protein